jgi:anti-sigma B factor antagonist
MAAYDYACHPSSHSLELPMSIVASKRAGILVVNPPPRMDTVTSPDAEQALAAAIDAGDIRIVVDFANTDYISSAGLRVLLKTAKLVAPKGGAVVLCNANTQVREVLEISGFLTMIPHYGSLKEAAARAGG